MSMSASVAETAPPSEKRLAAVLEHRFFLLLHMNVFWLRYAVAVITAYAAFVGGVKLWLIYIAARSGGSDWLDSINITGGGSSSSGSSHSFNSGGGKFGGGGSSGSWSDS